MDGRRVYVYSGPGTLVCFDARSGKILWSVDTVKEYGAQMMLHGICESPLVVGKHVICCPGGKDASVVALDKKTGKLAWRTTGISETQGYNSATLDQREWQTHRGGDDGLFRTRAEPEDRESVLALSI